MDNKEYLKQISLNSRPAKKSKGTFLKTPAVKIIGILTGLTIVILIFGSILTSGSTSLKDQAIALKLHLDNTSTIISDFQPSVKSSDLRSSSASLSSILSNTSRDLTSYLTAVYGYDNGSVPAGLKSEADLNRDSLESDLKSAKINGILDRIYARKMAYEISLLLGEESAIYNATEDTSLKSVLGDSYSSLSNLYDKFNDFSETK
ncbi:hypothetical protein IJH06_00750 [Candidatus Saccharibacteria bacterium]|nr:hypothetical protein [Candidatus Saccharibacteria bacterium]